MSDAILIQQIYPDTPGVKLLDLTNAHHAAYCEKWDMDFLSVRDPVKPEWNPLHGSWAKVELVRRALETGYEKVIWMDADTILWDLDTDLRDGCGEGIGACWHRIPQLHHWNIGVLTFTNTPRVRAFVDEWIANYPGDRGWLEQGVFNRLAMHGRVVHTLSDRWNATIHVNEVPDAVILAYHGCGDVNMRYELMKGILNKFPQESIARMGTGAG